jgi:hypothetical protein
MVKKTLDDILMIIRNLEDDVVEMMQETESKAHLDGFNDGYETGYDKGLKEGEYQKGYSDGYSQAEKDGKLDNIK